MTPPREHLANTLNGYVQEVCPVAAPIKAESAAIAANRKPSGDRTA